MESKNKFFTFIFSFIPGAGHMYLGMMTKGTVFMSLFFGIFAILAYFGLEVFMAFLPVVWCYSFFDVLNLKHLTYEERIASEKKFESSLRDIMGNNWFFSNKRQRVILGWALIIIGLNAIYDRVFLRTLHMISSWFGFETRLGNLTYNIGVIVPTFVVALLLIIMGVKVLKNNNDISKKNELYEEDLVEYKGEDMEEKIK